MPNPSDLSDAQWDLLCTTLARTYRSGGRPHSTDLRRTVNGILYSLTTGCQWRALPAEFQPWERSYQQFVRWRDNGRWKRLFQALHPALRHQAGRSTTPHLLVADTQTVQSAPGNSPRRKRGA